MEGDWATTAIWKLEILGAGPVGRRQGYNCNLGTRDFLVAGPVAEIFWVAGPVGKWQDYNCNLRSRGFLRWWLVRRQGYNDEFGLVTVDLALSHFRQQTQSQLRSGNLKILFGGRPSWKATGPQLQSGNSRFWGQAQLEGDRATTAIWELEFFFPKAAAKGSFKKAKGSFKKALSLNIVIKHLI